MEKVLTNQGRTDELKDKLSDSISKHINKVWKEHKIKLNISINGDDCEVYVEDKDKKYTYFQMKQRSDGFKQFISLILSLSALNESDNLRNNIVLIDEPEVHLHPSGARFMRDELLKIGRNNIVLVATHSHYMIDTNCPQRHWIVKKEKGQTSLSQITSDTPLEDDAVLSAAFGLNLYKELLPNNIIIVEGQDDKSIISHCLNLTRSHFFYSIKAAKGATKVYGIAALLNEESIPAYIVFDDDKEGRDNKKKVIDNLKESFNEENVFTLKDLLPQIPKDATIEDLLPLDFSKKFFEIEMAQEFDLTQTTAVLSQIKNQCQKLKDDKQKLDSLKMKLATNFIKAHGSKNSLEKNAPILITFVETLLGKFESKK